MAKKESIWKKEFKGLDLRSWIGLAGMIASIIYYILSKIFGWGSSEPTMALIAASTFFTVSYLGGLLGRLSERLAGVEVRLTGMDTRLAGTDGRLVGMDTRLASMDTRLASMDTRLASMDERLLEIRDLVKELVQLLKGLR